MKFNLKHIAVALGLGALLALTGCGESKDEQAQVLKVGVMAGPETELAEIASKVAKEKYNLDVELVTFNDYVTPNTALHDKSIDLNAFQHKPYLDAQVKDKGYQFAIAGNTLVYPIAAYSKSIKNISELKEGDKVALPNDLTNLGRSLILLEKQGLLKLKDNAGLTATALDIVENPLNLEFVELPGAQLPHALNDVQLAVINNTFAGRAGLTAEKDSLFVEDKESPYVNLIVARQDNVNDEKVKQFVQSYQTDAVFNKALELFDGGAVKGW
ncbi:D-methionine-binding lipoprotein MetQ [Vibrio stylophorae]|uniref:Lipoprotein n=1 Tax=Vibrio stylophorae TaxID=659351 RepID=A0ABM8ZV65_9VIBR|nr:methionine ABC transporter substrate-binding lipoprotein MetQ [Vibrio stylophorae]CAH0534210.1 D-methionine-binding lipoprotein MetQ [Vibrio stylophorae]